MANHKIHLRQGKNGIAACAVKGVDSNGRIVRNSRITYQAMAVSAVSPEEFRAIPSNDRCSHCCDRFTPMMNARRKLKGLPLYADAMNKVLK